MLHPEKVNPHVGIIIWRFEPPYTKDDAEAKESYAWLKQVLQDFSSFRHNIYYDIDQPSVIAMVGGWQSLQQHFAELHKSEEFGEILDAFGGLVDMRSNFHVNLGNKELEEVSQGDILCVTRAWVGDEKQESFERRWREDYGKQKDAQVAMGWRISEGLWFEKDAIDYWEEGDNDNGLTTDAVKGDGEIEDPDLQTMNELVTLVGFESVKQQEEAWRNAQFPKLSEYSGVAKRAYSRRFAKMDMST